MTRLQIGQSCFNITDFLFSEASRLVLGPTPLLIQVTGHSYPKSSAVSMKLTTHPHLKIYFHSPSMPSWCGQGHLYLYFYIYYQCLHPWILTRSFVFYLTSLLRNCYLRWTNSYKNYHIRELKKVQNCYTITILAHECKLLLHEMQCSQSWPSLLPSQVW